MAYDNNHDCKFAKDETLDKKFKLLKAKLHGFTHPYNETESVYSGNEEVDLYATAVSNYFLGNHSRTIKNLEILLKNDPFNPYYKELIGEVYFANKLTDYDPSINNGNWQWVSSVGVDPKPYFQRLFNPFIQSEKFDSDCEYIRKWIPSLKKVNIPNKHLHNWEKHYKKYNLETIDYVEPVVSYKEARQKSVDMYREVL